MTDADDAAPGRRGLPARTRRSLRALRTALIGPPPRSAASNAPWEHHASYMRWLEEYKKPDPLRSFLAHWFAIAFILASVLGGLLWFAHRTLGWQ